MIKPKTKSPRKPRLKITLTHHILHMHSHSDVEERDLGPPMTPPLSTPLAPQLFSRFRVPGSRPDDGLQRPKHVVLQLRFTHIICNKLVCNSCLVRNLHSYIYLLCSTFSPTYFNTLISTTRMIHLNNKHI